MVKVLEFKESKTISAADSAGEEWENTKFWRSEMSKIIKANGLLFYGNIVDNKASYRVKRKYLEGPIQPLRGDAYVIELGGVFEEIGGTDETIGGGNQKMGSANK